MREKITEDTTVELGEKIRRDERFRKLINCRKAESTRTHKYGSVYKERREKIREGKKVKLPEKLKETKD